MSTSTRFKLKVFARVLKKRHPGQLHFTFFSPKKLVRLFIPKEVKPSTESKMVKLLTFDYLFPPQLLRMTMAVTFSRPNDVGSRTRTTLYLVLRKSRTHSRFKINIFCSVIFPPPTGYHVKVTRMLREREGGREG